MASFAKQLFPFASEVKFTPASSEVNWTRVETLVHGPAAWEQKQHYNSAIFACLMAIANAYPEPPLIVVQETADGTEEKLVDHPLQDILDHPTPNGELSPEEMRFWTAWAKHVDGNAYWLKVRSGNAESGNVVQLWPISPTMMEPATRKGSDEWISYYKYRIRPNETIRVPVQNVIHFRLGLDDQDMRKGISPLKALIRQIATDDEADKFVAALLKNYAIPGLVVSPTAGGTIQEQDAEKMTNKLRQKFGNSNRGNIAVLSKESQIQQFGFSPEQLDMSILHRIPEERISAVLGVPAIVAGLGAGLDRATYANFREAREMFTEQKLVPQWRSDAAKLNIALKPDFVDDKSISIKFDITDVRAFQEDMNEKYQRLSIATAQKAFLLRNEARTEVGFDEIPEWDIDRNPPTLPQMPPQFGQGNQGSQGPEQPPQGQEEPQTARMLDLNNWRHKATKALEHGKPASVQFISDHIPLALAGAISGALEGAKTESDIQAIFYDVWQGYP